MGVVKKQTSWTTIVSYIGVLVGYVNVALLFPAIFGVGEGDGSDELGLRTTLINFSMLFGQICLLGFQQSTNKFFPEFEGDKKKMGGFLTFVLVVPAISFIVFSLILYLVREPVAGAYAKNSPMFLEYFYLVFPLTLLLMMSAIVEMYCRSLKKIVVPNIIRDVGLKLLTTILLGFYAWGIVDIDTFWNLLIAIYLIALIGLLMYVASLKKLYLNFNFSFLTKKFVSSFSAFSFFSLLSGIAGTIVITIDGLMISSIDALASTGVYTIGVFFSNIIDIPRRSLSQIAIPIVTEAFVKRDMETVKSMYKKASITQMVTGFGIFILIWTNVDDLFKFIPDSETYSQAKWVVLFMGMARLFTMSCGINGTIIQFSQHYRFNLYAVLFLAVVTVSTNYYLIPYYKQFGQGFTGAAIASAISMFLFNVMRSGYIWLVLRMQPFTIKSLLCLVVTGVTYLSVFWIPEFSSPFLGVLVKGTIGALVYGSGIYFLNLSPDINGMIDGILLKVGIRLKRKE